MSDKKEIKPLKVEMNLSYKDESIVHNADIISVQSTNVAVPDIKINVNLEPYYEFNKTYNLVDYDTEEPHEMDLIKLQQFYHDNGNSTEKTYEYLKSYILENKDNPKALNSAISHLLNNLEGFYDHYKSHTGVAKTQLEVFDKILKAPGGSEIDGMICGPIHEFAMNLLHECGIRAALPVGKSLEGENHCTLLYQGSDGKYVFNDYGKSLVLNSTNILDALREVSKNSGDFDCNGYLTLENGGKTSFQKFAYREESTFGHEMDKGDYNNQSLFEHSVSDNSAVRGQVEVSNFGNTSAEIGGTLAYGNSNVKQETSLTLGYKTSGETAMFHSSQSIGAKIEHKQIKLNDNGETFFEVKGIVSHIQGEIGGQDYGYAQQQERFSNAYDALNSAIKRDLADAGIEGESNYQGYLAPSIKNTQISNLTAFIRAAWSKKNTLFQNDNLELNNVGQVSGTLGSTIALEDSGVNGDARVLAEDGLELVNKGETFQVKNNISAGIAGDLKIAHTGIGLGIQPSIKLNAGTGFEAAPANNLAFGANVKAYGVLAQPAKSYGGSAEAHVAYRPNNSVTLFGNTGVFLERQQLTLGGFNERVEDRTTFTALVGADFNNKISLSAGYKQEINPLNRTRNYSTFNLGAAYRF